MELRSAHGLFLGGVGGVKRKMEEIDGGGCLFVCLIRGGREGERDGKKQWNINFLFAVFIIGRRRSEMTNGEKK